MTKPSSSRICAKIGDRKTPQLVSTLAGVFAYHGVQPALQYVGTLLKIRVMLVNAFRDKQDLNQRTLR